MGKESEDGSAPPRPIILKLRNEDKKKEMYKARIKMSKDKGTRPICINEDLTSARSQLAQKLRQEAKNSKIHSTWTMDGDLFAKKGQQDKPRRIKGPRDLEQLIKGAKENETDHIMEHDPFGGETNESP